MGWNNYMGWGVHISLHIIFTFFSHALISLEMALSIRHRAPNVRQAIAGGRDWGEIYDVLVPLGPIYTVIAPNSSRHSLHGS